MKHRITAGRLTLILVLASTVPAIAIEWTFTDGVARGFPALRDSSGRKIADGDFMQWIEKDRLRVKISYAGQSRRIEEACVFRQRPELVQEHWSIRELRNEKLYRQFVVDFTTGKAQARKLEDGELKEWSEDLKLGAGRAFAGFGFTLAARAVRERLMKGERIELQAIGFTPKPRAVTVEMSYGGLDRIRMGGRTIRGERYAVHPELPFIADLFVKVPDAHIWLTNPGPATFLRWEGPLAEPSDPITRVDLLPGGISGPAAPIGARPREQRNHAR